MSTHSKESTLHAALVEQSSASVDALVEDAVADDPFDPAWPNGYKPIRRVRFTATIKARWTGVATCCDDDRTKVEAWQEVTKWRNGIVAARPRWTGGPIARGPFKAHCDFYQREFPNNTQRECIGNAQFVACADFFWFPRRDDPDHTDRELPGGTDIDPKDGASYPWDS